MEIDEIIKRLEGLHRFNALLRREDVKALDAAIETLDRMTWISVKDRLPENDNHVLCCTETKKGMKNVIIGYYMNGAWRCGMNSNVTHWMPLPELPGLPIDELKPDDYCSRAKRKEDINGN